MRQPPVAGHIVWQLISFVCFFGLWELVGRWPISAAFPPFSQTLLALWQMIADGSLGNAYLSTLQPLVIGIVLCGMAGIGFGIGMGLSRTIEWFSLPIFIILQAAPMAPAPRTVMARIARQVSRCVLASVILNRNGKSVWSIKKTDAPFIHTVLYSFPRTFKAALFRFSEWRKAGAFSPFRSFGS